MKTLLLSLVLGVLVFCLPAASQAGEFSKALSVEPHTVSSFSLNVDNYGCYTDLIYPASNGALYLYSGNSWISAKRYRRDPIGNLLYWLAQNPSADSSTVVSQTSPLWNPSLKIVIDTLTTNGFDGDKDLFELLPAYNPFLAGNSQTLDLYELYSSQDIVLRSILGYPAPLPFVYPDPLGIYCFSQPQDYEFETPGYETLSAYYYDFCPFGTMGDRDFGSSRDSNIHYPLGLAIHQQSFAWSNPNYNQFIVFHKMIYNTSTVDTLYDLALAEFLDCDIKPAGSSSAGASDDVSGYIKGDGYEFAYSRDYDGDGGLAPNLVAHKLMLPGVAVNRVAWFWQVGNGPDDYSARNLNHQPRYTANEKYWLTTGSNPNVNKFHPLRPDQEDVMEYEQPNPADTRFLTTLFGAVPTSVEPNPPGRMHLSPGDSISYYSIVFVGNSIADLKQRSQAIETFINSGFTENDSPELTMYSTLTAYPNPFNPSTTIGFGLPESGEVKLSVFNSKGQKIRELLNANLPKGSHNIVWNGTDDTGKAVASGLYFCRLNYGNQVKIQKMVLLK